MMIAMPKKPAPDSPAAKPPPRVRRWLALVAVAGTGAALMLSTFSGSPAAALSTEPEAPLASTAFETSAEQNATGDHSKFPHTNQAHTRLPCLLCHRREDNSPQPKRSGHTPCAGCHVQQFAASSGPICAICHTSA